MEMDRLDYKLPESTRVQWASGQSRGAWQPRLHAAVRALQDMEIRSVALGMRKACVLAVEPYEMPMRAAELARMGMGTLPLHRTLGRAGDTAILIDPPPDDQLWNYQVLAYSLHKNVVLDELNEDTAGADRKIGELLGYPPCCIEVYCRRVVEQRYIDTTWPMAAGTPDGRETGPRALEMEPYPECNVLGRWYGLKPVPHLPCSFRCEATRTMGMAWAELGRRLGYEAEMDTLAEMTRWPVEWSALHGYAEIKTPAMRVLSTTDTTPAKYVVRSLGDRYPNEGATGLSFPWKRQTGNVQSRGRAFRSFLTPEVREKWYYTDNEFTSYKAQEQGHRALLDAIKECAALVAPKQLSVCHLGCGNGALLLEASEEVERGLVVHGCDGEPDKIAHARILHKGTGSWTVASEADYPLGDYDLILHEPGHTDRSHCATLWRHARFVALYCYPDGDVDKTLDGLPSHAGQQGQRGAMGMALQRTFSDEGTKVHLWGRGE